MAKYYSSTLQKGAKGDETKQWQEFLNTQGYGLAVDGDFGDKTDAATRDYQKKNGLTVDGIVGANTWGKAGYSISPSQTNFEYEDFSFNDYTESDIVTQAKNALDAQLSQKPGEYTSQWQTQLDETINKILNREKFSYDLNGDALYQQYKDKYIQQGKMAMQDTMGQAAAMTGGYGNSYAQSVGQQAYNAQLENLNDVVPELYQMAYDRYNQEGQDLYNQYSMLGAQENQDYGRHRDKVSDYQTERDYLTGRYDAERTYDYNKYSTERDFAYGQYADDKSYAYSEHRNAITDEQWQKEFEEAKRQYDESQKKSNVTGSNKDNTVDVDDDEPVVEPEDKDTYADWDAGDWQSYFAQIRNSDGKSAAEEELNRMTKAGLIPKNMTSYAAIGARGSLGH